MKQLRHIVTTLALSLALVFGVAALVPATTFADASTDAARKAACEGSGGTWAGTKCTTAGPALDTIVHNVVNVLSIIIGIAAVIMIMVGGFKYITANGDPGNAKGARQT